MPRFSKRSLNKLSTCHEDIQKVLKEAIKYFDFSVLCGHRDKQTQDEAYYQGFSKLKFPYSKHNKKPSLAVDVAPYPIDWQDTLRFSFIAGVILTISNQMGVKLEWGGHWKRFKDYPHFQLKNIKK